MVTHDGFIVYYKRRIYRRIKSFDVAVKFDAKVTKNFRTVKLKHCLINILSA